MCFRRILSAGHPARVSETTVAMVRARAVAWKESLHEKGIRHQWRSCCALDRVG